MMFLIALVLLGGLGWISLVRLRWQSRRLRQALRHADKAQQETSSGIADSLAIELCMHPELQWAVRQGVPAAVLVLSVRDGDVTRAGERLSQAARRFERACAVDGEPAFALLLWNVDEAGVRASAARLARAMVGDDDWVVEAGFAIVPGDALAARAAVELALERSGPIEATAAAGGSVLRAA
ncbi:MAG: hypothetical protein JWM98_541 [Thermoleophilia bacterium]|nr:hypothetical protein [Thermoleophilia bacterium]